MSVRSLFVTVLIAGFCVGLYAQKRNPGDVISVQFSHDVVVGDKMLPAGPWNIYLTGSTTDPTLMLYHDNVFNAEVPVVLIGSEDNQKRPETEAVIEKIGTDYFLTNVWIKGERSGYALRLPPQTATLRNGDVHHLPAKFISASWFAQGAEMEGQARSHNGQGLGGPEGSTGKGIVVARAYEFRMPPTELVAENRPSEDVVVVTEEQIVLLDTSNQAPPELEPEPIAIVQVPEPLPIIEEPVVTLQSENNVVVALPEIEEPLEITPALPEAEAIAEVEVAPEELPAFEETEVAALSEQEPIEQPAEFQGLPDTLPATASNWAAFLLLGGALITLALRVRRMA